MPSLPFGEFERLHFARFALLDDATHGRPRGLRPAAARACRSYLVFHRRLRRAGRRAAGRARARARARACAASSRTAKASTPARDLLAWMRRTMCRSAASYVNWVGRTVRQVREESALQRALAAQVPRDRQRRAGEPQAARRAAGRPSSQDESGGRPAVADAGRADAARLAARQARRTWSPCRWSGSSLLPLADRAVAVRSSCCCARARRRDPEFCPRPTRPPCSRLQQLEDHDITNSSPRSARSSRAGSGAGW